MLFTVIDDPSSHEVISFKNNRLRWECPLCWSKRRHFSCLKNYRPEYAVADFSIARLLRSYNHDACVEHNKTVFEDQNDNRSCDHCFLYCVLSQIVTGVNEFQLENQMHVELSSLGTFDIYSQRKILKKKFVSSCLRLSMLLWLWHILLSRI